MGSTDGAKAVRCADDAEDEEEEAKSLVSRRHRCDCGEIFESETRAGMESWRIREECKTKINGENSLTNHFKKKNRG
jgi:hypothetical protein